jgi:predicted chitinase
MDIIDEVKKILCEEMDKRGWLDNDWRAGLAAIIGGESGFVPKFETGWARTSNQRIRQFFSSRVGGLSNAELDRLKANNQTWFNFIYGSQFQVGRDLGNQNPEDGYRFRGGGLIQLTGRYNYDRYGQKVGADLVNHPDLILTPRVSCAVAVEYMKDRFSGGDFVDMKRAVGVSIGEPNEEKNRLYAEYRQTEEWNYRPGASGDSVKPVEIDAVYDPIVTVFLESLENLQVFLKSKHLYTGPIDSDPGPGTRAALRAYLARR